MKFEAVKYEEYPWHSTFDTDLLSRRQRKMIVSSYKAALPCKIEKADFPVSPEFQAEIDDAVILATRFDEMLKSKKYNIPAMKAALSLDSKISYDLIIEIHKTLLHKTNANIAGKLRGQQVWIGGNNLNPIVLAAV
ncbi:MAG: hypothetical protein LBU89_13120 [Fibromonadaceae bacterium]|jgi:hypothetical protein|nr:hypothetical protein [Fibromonadaceae bacterium]